MVRNLEALGGAVWYTELPGRGHNVWEESYNRLELYEWMLNQRRGAKVIRPPASRNKAMPQRLQRR
jgi:hypothetical protein